MAKIPKDVRKPVSFVDCKNVKLCSVDANVLPFEKKTDKNKEFVETNKTNKKETMTIDLNEGKVIQAKDMDERTLLCFEKMRQAINVKEKRRRVSKTGDKMVSFEDKVAEKKMINFEQRKEKMMEEKEMMKQREDGGQEIS